VSDVVLNHTVDTRPLIKLKGGPLYDDDDKIQWLGYTATTALTK